MPSVLDYHPSDLDNYLQPLQLSLLKEVASEAARRRLPLYLVGGFVRDLLLGSPATDFDLVVEGDAIALARSMAARHGGYVTAHSRFGTAQWFLPGEKTKALDFSSTRAETYRHPAALPSVGPGCLRDDLLRRDFSLNALALRLDGRHWGELRDDLGGLADLKQGMIRVLHPLSFTDDPTRIFRAVRYEGRYGFQITPSTLALISPALQFIHFLSPQRLRRELELLLDEQNSILMLDRLAELEILPAIHPALDWGGQTRRRFLRGLDAASQEGMKKISAGLDRVNLSWHLWLIGLSVAELESLNKRLHFRAGLFSSLLAALLLLSDVPSLVGEAPSRWVKRLGKLPLTAVAAVYLSLPKKKGGELLEFLKTWRHVKPNTDGFALQKLGLPPSPRYQKILERLRAAWLDGEVASQEAEVELLDKLINLV